MNTRPAYNFGIFLSNLDTVRYVSRAGNIFNSVLCINRFIHRWWNEAIEIFLEYLRNPMHKYHTKHKLVGAQWIWLCRATINPLHFAFCTKLNAHNCTQVSRFKYLFYPFNNAFAQIFAKCRKVELKLLCFPTTFQMQNLLA